MAVIDVIARQFTKFEVLMPTDDFAPAIAECRFIPNTTTATWKGGTPDAVFTAVSTPTWTCQMRLAQDWENADSLAHYLLENAGETIEGVLFTPIEGGTQFEADLVLAAPEIGGAIDSWGETTVTHGVNGQPAPVVTP